MKLISFASHRVALVCSGLKFFANGRNGLVSRRTQSVARAHRRSVMIFSEMSEVRSGPANADEVQNNSAGLVANKSFASNRLNGN